MICFEHVLRYGNLELEKVLFMFDQTPIVFVCIDSDKNRYLCQCTDLIVGYSWMITQISSEILIAMIRDEISILSAFSQSGNLIIMADQLKDGSMTYREVDFKQIPEDDLPDKEEKLENPNLDDYVRKLQESNNLWCTFWVGTGYAERGFIVGKYNDKRTKQKTRGYVVPIDKIVSSITFDDFKEDCFSYQTIANERVMYKSANVIDCKGRTSYVNSRSKLYTISKITV